MRIASTISDSIVDGPGLRFTVFTQGCPHGCPGCHNHETHDPDGGREEGVEALAERLAANPLTDGLTLSGGEPFLQGMECAALARLAHGQGKNVWTYTGYTFEALLAAGRADWNALLAETDVLVDGPFLLAQKSYSARFRGSANQRLQGGPGGGVAAGGPAGPFYGAGELTPSRASPAPVRRPSRKA